MVPSKLTVTNVAYGKQCFVKELGVEGLTVYVRGADGQPAGGNCTVEITGPKEEPIDVQVEDAGDGTFHAKYKPLNVVVGEYLIYIKIDSELVSQYRVKCVEGGGLFVENVADIKQCFVRGPGLEELMVYIRDHDGKPTDGGCIVEIEGPDGPIEVEMEDAGDGVIRAKYAPLNLVSGEYVMSALVDLQPIAKFRVKTVAGSPKFDIENMPDTRQCEIDSFGPESLNVRVRDFDGKPTNGLCAVEINGPQGPIPVQVAETNVGSFKAKYPALNKQPGDYAMKVKVDSQPIANFNVKVVPGSSKLNVTNLVNGKNCYVEGPGLEELTVYVRGIDGQPADGNCEVEIKDPNKKPMEVKIESVGDGIYRAKYNSLNSVPGNYFIDVKVDSEVIAKFSAKSKANSSNLWIGYIADLSRCFVKGPGLEELMIYVLGFDGTPTDALCKVNLKGPNGKIEIRPEGTSKGTYCAKYTALNSVPGEYVMEVMVNWIAIAKFHITSVEGSSKFSIRNMANVKGCSIVGQPNSEKVTVSVRGFDGKPMQGICTAEIVGPNGPVEIQEVEDAGNGTFTIKYGPLNKDPGSYMFDIMVDSETLQKFRLNVISSDAPVGKTFGQPADLKQCFIEGPGLEELSINILGANGEPADGQPQVQINGPDGAVKVKTEIAGDAVYRMTYSSLNSLSGEYVLLVLVNNRAIAKFVVITEAGSTDFNTKPMADKTQCTMSDVTPTGLKVVCKGFDGKPTESKVTVTVGGPKGPLPVEVKKADNGTYLATYPSLQNEPGSYELTAMVDSVILQRSTMNVTGSRSSRSSRSSSSSRAPKTFGQAADPKQCSVDGPGLEELSIHVRGSNGEPADGQVGAQIIGPNGPVGIRMELAGDAIYRIKYPSLNSLSGDYTIMAHVNGKGFAKFLVKTIAGSSDVNVSPMADRSQCKMSGISATGMTLVCKGYDENPIEGKVKITVEGPSGLIDVEVKETELGTFVATYTLKESGAFKISGFVDSQSVGVCTLNMSIG